MPDACVEYKSTYLNKDLLKILRYLDAYEMLLGDRPERGSEMNQENIEAAMAFHGHKCPAMPLGLRAARAALKALGVERAQTRNCT